MVSTKVLPEHTIVVRCMLYNPYTGKFLILLRKLGKKDAQKLEFPDGKVNRGESVAVAIRREIFEETGRNDVEIDFVHHFYESHVGDENGPEKHRGGLIVTLTFIGQLTGLLGTELEDPQIVLDPDEHDAHVWSTYKELQEHRLTRAAYQAAFKLKGRLFRL